MKAFLSSFRQLFTRTPAARVLVVEDDASFRLLYGKLLATYRPGREVLYAKSMEEALNELRTKAFELVILDHNLLGRETGMDLWNLCKYYYPGSKLLVISGRTEEEILGKSNRTNEMPYFLRKPFAPADFGKALAAMKEIRRS